jgi:hypothetical protein
MLWSQFRWLPNDMAFVGLVVAYNNKMTEIHYTRFMFGLF